MCIRYSIKMSSFLCVVCVTILAIVLAHPGYRDNIPNGYNVMNPCPARFDHWEGVGHVVFGGGGLRNLFGQAYAKANGTWTTALCNADSDGDGFSNGLELGDPNCVWVKGGTPQFKPMGHPGVCTPMFTDACDAYNVNISCY